jgi:hypothetical protein
MERLMSFKTKLTSAKGFRNGLRRAGSLSRRLMKSLLTDSIVLEGIPPLSDKAATEVEPVFVLSTGRCGTKWLTELLSRSNDVFVNHALQPELIRQSRRAYELGPTNVDFLTEIVRAARDDLISAAHQRSRVYVETNNKITFFAFALKNAYPRSRFVHLYRHPADFVRSGMRRGWYSGHSHDVGRIVMKESGQWERLSRVERIAWLWNETNSFIEVFLQELEPDRSIAVQSEQMFSDGKVTLEICRFVGGDDISSFDVNKMLGKRVNVQRQGDFPRFEEWTVEQQEILRKWCTLASKYRYDLETGGTQR